MRKAFANGPGGYTIVETLIYLAITSALFLSASILIAGQQGKAEFSQTAREVESVVRDVLNDISTGYYPTDESLQCFVNPSGNMIINPGGGATVDQGTNKGCIFLGRVLHFPIDSDDKKMTVYTVVGRQVSEITGDSVRDYDEADPVSDTVLPKNEYNFSGSISFQSVKYSGGDMGAFGVYSALSSGGSGGVNLLPIDGTTSSTNQPQLFTRIRNGSTAVQNPASGIEICIKSNTTDQYASIMIGENRRALNVETIINTTDCT